MNTFSNTPHEPQSLAEIDTIIASLRTLAADLRAARLESANLRAAIRAALGADTDGEADPLAYLRDELHGAPRGRP